MAKKESTIDCYLIVNEKILWNIDRPLKNVIVKEGDLYYCDDYGMGSFHWPIINSPGEAFERQLRENVRWAQERLSWAGKNAPDEIPELQDIIASNGYARFPGTLEKFKKLRDKEMA